MRLEYFQMVDRIAALDLETRSIAVDSVVPEASPVFEGHFPGYPILPGVLMIETMAQSAGWLVMALLKFERMVFLAQVREAKLRHFVAPGQPMRVEARLLHDGSGYAVASARILADARPVADAELTFRVLPFPNDTMRAGMRAAAARVAMPADLLA